MAWPRTAAATPFEAGVVALERRRPNEALTHFAAALAAADSLGRSAIVHNKRAVAYLALGQRDEAVAALSDALAADPTCVPAIVNTGNLLLEDGLVADALEHYEAALRLDADYAPAHLNAGIAYKRLGRRGDAVRSFRKASRLEATRKRRG